MNVEIFKKIYHLCEDYSKTEFLTPTDYIDTNVANIDEDVLFHFINLHRHDAILRDISDHFLKLNEIITSINMKRLKVIFYILIFALKSHNISKIQEIFIVLSKIRYVKQILLYYDDEENLIHTAEIALKSFDNEYVMNNIIQPILHNKQKFHKLLDFLNEREYKLYHKDVTVPIELNVAKRSYKIPIVPVNTPIEPMPFQANKIPKTTYLGDTNVQKKIQEEHEKNRAKAIQLLEKVKSEPNHESIPKEKKTEVEVTKEIKRKPIKLFIKKNVPIKKNLTTVMREAALYAKGKEYCIKEIDDILKGGVDTKLAKEFEEEMREIEKQKQIKEVERNRLKCLLSHEDAIIAKCKVRELNKQKKMAFLEEQKETKRRLVEWKLREKEKYRLYIQEAQESNRRAKESEEKLMEEKIQNARLLQWETKMLLNKAMEEKEQELARKMHMIQEIKAMHNVRGVEMGKQFDKTECSNLGLLCEMSIAELEERLHLMKAQMEEDLNEKRKCIMKMKNEKQKLIEEAENFIKQNREIKQKVQTVTVLKLEESPEIRELREKLDIARKIRRSM
ncbi:hypothetical protein WA026_001134 [Henosepilachna vigintioctopunctata]|uniref:Cilia- and flagella-associated protein 99-like n=1 Tax=Henosepilachna vigintioctopunctata TaxID=420089 RepID=A0AAW1V693_9CUCU